jgi:hypothetical protein
MNHHVQNAAAFMYTITRGLRQTLELLQLQPPEASLPRHRHHRHRPPPTAAVYVFSLGSGRVPLAREWGGPVAVLRRFSILRRARGKRTR